MLISLAFILGAFFGALVMFAARLADKNVTTIVERYKDTGSILKPDWQPGITLEDEDAKEEFVRSMTDKG